MNKNLIVYITFIIIFFTLTTNSSGQVVFQDVSNNAIYEFLDELANQQIIQINSAIKPYSRRFIAESLQKAATYKGELSQRQQEEIEFYLRDYNKELKIGKFENKRFDIFYYRDSLFTISINGILGAQGWSNENGINYHRWYGAEVFSYAGNHLGIYASLRDNSEKIPLADTGYINLRHGGKYRSGDYSEMRGGFTYSWKWGHVALVKDYIEWGTSYRCPNIISSKAPSFAQFKLQITPVDWFEFNYVHGWLVSEVVDSSRSYNYNGIQRDVFHSKYFAANMFSFKPWRKLNFSLGNSIVYSDQLNPAYFIPIFFYKSVDHTYNAATNTAGQNSQMFFDISSRLLPKTHMYYSMFLDVMSFSTLTNKEKHANHWSMLGGIRISNLLPNTSLTLEYVRNNPLVYKNDNSTTLYNSNWYSMGHYLKDNAQELYIAIDFRPLKTLHIKTWYSLAQKGPDYTYDRDLDPETGISMVLGKTFMESVEWEQQEIGISANYQLLNDLFLFGDIQKANRSGAYERYNSPYYWGNTLTYSFGLNFGF
jgi:hypothetical protein